MCEILKGTCGAVCFVPTMLGIVINILLTITILVLVADDDSAVELGLQWMNQQLNIEVIEEYVDLSHYPYPSEEFANPACGDCCDDMCRDSPCQTGVMFLGRWDSCNNCCFHFSKPGSCNEFGVCLCYSNDQSLCNRRRSEELADNWTTALARYVPTRPVLKIKNKKP